MPARSEHLHYLRRRFVLDVDGTVFSTDELKTLARYGTWLQALEAGLIQPISREQEHFLLVVAEESESSNAIESVWLKYKRRKQALAEMQAIPHYELRDQRQTWYSDEAYRKGIHFPRRTR